MSIPIAEKAAAFILNNSGQDLHVSFSGGEPLLNLKVIKKTINLILENSNGKNIHFSIITNGTLITKEIIQFFKDHNFGVQLSVILNDPTGDSASGFTFDFYDRILKSLLVSGLNISSTTVFHPGNISVLTPTVQKLKAFALNDIGISFDLSSPWTEHEIAELEKQLNELCDIYIHDCVKNNHSPIGLFNLEKGNYIHGCAAGHHQVSITAEGDIWGCDCFYHYYQNTCNYPGVEKYRYGNLMLQDTKEILDRVSNVNHLYSSFRADRYHTEKNRCFLCPDVRECFVCPAIYYSDNNKTDLFLIPEYVCQINKVLIAKSRSLRIKLANQTANLVPQAF